MLVIRLFRVGKTNQPLFKIVVTQKINPPRGGEFIEEVGFYNPLTKEKVLKQDRIQYWLSQGAQPSDTAHNLFVKEGILQTSKIPVHKKSKKPASAPLSGAAAGKPAGEAPKQEAPKLETSAENPATAGPVA